MEHDRIRESKAVANLSLFFSLAFFAASFLAAIYTGEKGETIRSWVYILTSPAQLVTDYYMIGSLSAAFFNAGMCGMACTILLYWTKAACQPSNWAGYFLVIAHCFYGLNFLNMWPTILGVYVYCVTTGKSFRHNLDVAMFSTAFGPFMSELMTRYPLAIGFKVPFFFSTQLDLVGFVLAIVLGLFLGFTIPAMLPGALLLHRGFNLYNGGLAFGLLGMFVYAFLFKTQGYTVAEPSFHLNEAYLERGASYGLFTSVFFIVVFLIVLAWGWCLNGKSFKGYGKLLKNTGYKANFLESYGIGCTYINLGFYGLMMVAYFNAVVLFTDGAGWTGATCGVTLAAMTFAAGGQHPKNVWPILLGYFSLYIAVLAECTIVGKPMPWTLSTQGYINGLAFATGLCPFAGHFNRRIGVLAGFIGAVMCTTTSAMHGGFVLYNGGLTAGITALILTPMLDHYWHGKVHENIDPKAENLFPGPGVEEDVD